MCSGFFGLFYSLFCFVFSFGLGFGVFFVVFLVVLKIKSCFCLINSCFCSMFQNMKSSYVFKIFVIQNVKLRIKPPHYLRFPSRHF